MDISNKLMDEIKINDLEQPDPKTLLEINRKMRRGIISYRSASFFNWCFGSNVKGVLDSDLGGDLSYYEYVTNKTYFDPWVNSGLFAAALAGFDVLSTHWCDTVKLDVDIVLLFQTEGEFGESAAISFYLRRDGLPVFHERNVAAFNSPILLRRLRFEA